MIRKNKIEQDPPIQAMLHEVLQPPAVEDYIVHLSIGAAAKILNAVVRGLVVTVDSVAYEFC